MPRQAEGNFDRRRKPRVRARVQSRADEQRQQRTPAAQAQLQRSVQRARRSTKVKVDTGDITRGATGKGKAELRGALAQLGQDAAARRLNTYRRATLKENVEAELSGRGNVAHAAESVAAKVAPTVAKVAVRVAGQNAPKIPVKHKDKNGRTRVQMASVLGVDEKTLERGVQDIVNLPAQAIPSLYVPAAAAVEAARGRPQRARQLIRDIKRHDPIYALATGHPREARDRALEHPGFAAVEALGVKGSIGRGVTRAQELAGKRPTVRPAARLPGTNVRQERAYSRDAFARQRQKRREEDKRREARTLRTAADNLERQNPGEHADLIAEHRARADRIDPDRMKLTEAKRRANEREAINEMARREHRAQAVHETREAIGRKPTAHTTLRAQAIVDSTPEDLRAYLAEIRAEHPNLTEAGKRDNAALQSAILKALRDPADRAELDRAARAYADVMNPRTRALQQRGMIAPQTARKAPLVPYAARRLGARVENLDPLADVAREAQRQVRVAKAQRRRAGVEAQRAGRSAAREHGRARIIVARQGRRDEHSAVMLERQADALDAQAAELVRQGQINQQGKRASDPLADIGPLTRGQRRYRQKARRTGVPRQGVKVGSQRYNRGKRQIRRAAELRQRAEGLRNDAAALRGTAETRPVATLARLERAQARVMQARQAEVKAREAVPQAKRAARETRARRREAKGPELAVGGRQLHAADIERSMREHGIEPPAYVTQAPRGPSPFYVSPHRAPNVPRVRRTGTATTKGTFRADPEVMVESVARAQGLVDAFDGFAATLREFANPQTLGKLRDRKHAEHEARELEAKTGMRWRPVRINPFAGRTEQLHAMLDRAAGEGLDAETIADGGEVVRPLADALKSAWDGEDGQGPWALVPEEVARTFAEHAQKMGVGTASKVGQLAGQAFRRTVLATSPTWFAGNAIEASLRSALMRAGPRSYRFGRDVLARVDELSPQLGAELRRRATGGGHMASAATLHVRRGADQFEGTTLEPLARALHRFWQSPGPKQMADAWNRWTDLAFRQLNGRLESRFQTAMLGKALRSNPMFKATDAKTWAQAVDAAARGQLDQNLAAAAARVVERAYGKYNGFSPGMRWQIMMYTPFIAWTLNAYKFVFDVLPRDHPAATALTAAIVNATQDWRKDHGLDLFVAERLPGFLQGSIPLSGGRHQPASRYTPFGAFGSPLDTLGKAVLPQLTGVLAAFKGEDWKGAELRDSNGQPVDELGKAGYAAQAFAESTVPLFGVIKRVSQKGPEALNPARSYAPSKPKVRSGRSPGTVQQQLDRALGRGGSMSVQAQLDRALGR